MTMTRDETLAAELSALENEVIAARDTLAQLVGHALTQDATGHAALYADVTQKLTAAVEAVSSAHAIMLNADADDYT